uniref:Uncharacterized protein n=1 Tax=Megaselia scalaris TaxID=36166 RepID=T1GJ25_MEGSC
MAENSRTSKLSSKDDECIFSWKLFTGWDFMIAVQDEEHLPSRNDISLPQRVAVSFFKSFLFIAEEIPYIPASIKV